MTDSYKVGSPLMGSAKRGNLGVLSSMKLDEGAVRELSVKMLQQIGSRLKRCWLSQLESLCNRLLVVIILLCHSCQCVFDSEFGRREQVRKSEP